MHRRKLLLGIFSAVLAASCNDSPNDSPQEPAYDIRRQLVGRWLEGLPVDGNLRLSIVTLDQDGKFLELEKVWDANGSAKQETHAGEWSFDGVNFKRKYTTLNGQPLSNASFGYATYSVKSLEKDKFIGVDNVRAREARFSRTEASVP